MTSPWSTIPLPGITAMQMLWECGVKGCARYIHCTFNNEDGVGGSGEICFMEKEIMTIKMVIVNWSFSPFNTITIPYPISFKTKLCPPCLSLTDSNITTVDFALTPAEYAISLQILKQLHWQLQWEHSLWISQSLISRSSSGVGSTVSTNTKAKAAVSTSDKRPIVYRCQHSTAKGCPLPLPERQP